MSSLVTTAAILVGGPGSNLRAAVSHKPRVLTEVAGRSFLSYQLDHLAESDIKHVVLCASQLCQAIKAEFGHEYRGMNLLYSREAEPRGTGGALRQALAMMEGNQVLVLKGDSWCPADLTALVARHNAAEAMGTMLLTRVDDGSNHDLLEIREDGDIARIALGEGEPASSLVNAGVYVLDRRVMQSIPGEGYVSLDHDVLPAWAGKGLSSHCCSFPHLSIATPDRLAETEELLTPELASD